MTDGMADPERMEAVRRYMRREYDSADLPGLLAGWSDEAKWALVLARAVIDRREVEAMVDQLMKVV